MGLLHSMLKLLLARQETENVHVHRPRIDTSTFQAERLMSLLYKEQVETTMAEKNVKVVDEGWKVVRRMLASDLFPVPPRNTLQIMFPAKFVHDQDGRRLHLSLHEGKIQTNQKTHNTTYQHRTYEPRTGIGCLANE